MSIFVSTLWWFSIRRGVSKIVEQEGSDPGEILATAIGSEQHMDYDMAVLYYNRAGQIFEEQLDLIRAAESLKQETDCLSRVYESGDLSEMACAKAREACLGAEHLYCRTGASKDSNCVRELREYVDTMMR
ncbi:hypothetical protein ACFL6S_06515 [Candidatus Poribacteria bacterium]